MPEYTNEFSELMDEMYKFVVHKSIEVSIQVVIILYRPQKA